MGVAQFDHVEVKRLFTEAYGFGLPGYQKLLVGKKLRNIKYKECSDQTDSNLGDMKFTAFV